MQPTGTEPLVVGAGLFVLGALSVATFKMAWSLRDEVRDLVRTIADPRTGLVIGFDKLTALVQKHEERLDTLERWKDGREGYA